MEGLLLQLTIGATFKCTIVERGAVWKIIKRLRDNGSGYKFKVETLKRTGEVIVTRI